MQAVARDGLRNLKDERLLIVGDDFAKLRKLPKRAIDGYGVKAGSLCLYIRSCGLFDDPPGEVRGLDRALVMIDELKEFLSTPA